ncbi:hypothetical protein BOX15_Mlig004900g1, partial [Macrostomum lignano]
KYLINSNTRMLHDFTNLFEDLARSFTPASLICLLSIILLVAPTKCQLANQEPQQQQQQMATVSDLPIYRLHQFDMFGSRYGSRSAQLNFEARTVASGQLNRKCVVARVQELSGAVIKRLVQDNVGAILVLVPPALLQDPTGIPTETRAALHSLEQDLWGDSIPVPVYFLAETPDFSRVFEDMRRIDQSNDFNSPLRLIANSVLGNTYHVAARSAQSKPIDSLEFVAMHGFLYPQASSAAAAAAGVAHQGGSEGTIVISAYMDWFGSVPTLGRGFDSNGSGMLLLLRLARLLSYYYGMPGVRPKYSVLFLLTSGGKLSYFGTKRWIEDNLESPDSTVLARVVMALCLDSVGLEPAVNLHVSKLPKEGTLMHAFYDRMRKHSEKPDLVQLRQKKINLANEWLPWEHERFSIKRLPGLTLSQCPSHSDCSHRLSVLDRRIDWQQLDSNYRTVAKSLLDLLLNPSTNVTDEQMMKHVYNDVDDSGDPQSAWTSYAQLLEHDHRSYHNLRRSDPYVQTLQSMLSPLVKDYRLVAFKPDRKEPEVVVYDASDSVLSVYIVKPALFDLFLAGLITAYLAIVFGFVVHFHRIAGLCLAPLLALLSSGARQSNGGKSTH